VPVQHYALALARGAGAEVVLATYQRLLREVRWFQRKEGGGEAYNVVMTRGWMCLLPRRRGGRGAIGTNGIGMLGVVWVADREERDMWTELGMEQHLVYMGYPRQES